jgi:Prolyl oligopeptidase, N-terminal beta-propeller domain
MVDTPKVPVGSTYHGVTVAEDYRWLEDPESDQPRSWAKAQDRLTRSYPESLPFRDAVRRRVAEVLPNVPICTAKSCISAPTGALAMIPAGIVLGHY